MNEVRSYYCGFCKGRHAKIETVMECSMEHYRKTGKQVNVNLKTPGARLAVEPASVLDLARPNAEVRLPSGHYLLPVKVPSGHVVGIHAQIRCPTKGKWRGQYFVNLWENGRASAILDPEDRQQVLQELKNGNWRRAMLSYGRTYSACPVCEEPLGPGEITSGVHKEEACYSVVY